MQKYVMLYMGLFHPHPADYVPAAVRLSEPGDCPIQQARVRAARLDVRPGSRTSRLRQAEPAVTLQCKVERGVRRNGFVSERLPRANRVQGFLCVSTLRRKIIGDMESKTGFS